MVPHKREVKENEETIGEEMGLHDRYEEIKDDVILKNIGTDHSYTHVIIWYTVYIYIVMHVLAAIALYRCMTGQVNTNTIIFSVIFYMVSLEGVTMGSHRLFAHRSYKATPILKILILMCHTMSGQHSALVWARDHRQHHRYSDTDGDPHNSNRGFIYSHIGWLVTKRHPIVKKIRKTIDISDLTSDKYVMFQYNHYLPLYILLGVMFPIGVPMYFFHESFVNSFLVSYMLTYTLSLNVILLVNSAAHKFGMRPYDKNICAADNALTTLTTLGEGWHNYHHAFPWDYKAAELNMPFNLTRKIIEFFAFLGLAYDLKSTSADVVYNRIKRSGDGTHQLTSKHMDDNE